MADQKTTGELRWRASEQRQVKNDPKWYALVIGIGAVLLTLAVIQRNFFFAVFVVVAAVTLIAENRQKPAVFDFSVTERGVGIGKNQFYPYDELEWFDMNERETRLDEIVIKRRTAFAQYLKLPIDRENAERAEKLLEEHLEKGTYEPSLLDTLLERIGL